MNCTCTGGCHLCGGEQVIRQVFNCPPTQRVVRHEHIVRHQHNTINEYDVCHEHEFTTRDVVREREVVNHTDCSSHVPNYCCERSGQCGPVAGDPAPMRPPMWRGRRW